MYNPHIVYPNSYDQVGSDYKLVLIDELSVTLLPTFLALNLGCGLYTDVYIAVYGGLSAKVVYTSFV